RAHLKPKRATRGFERIEVDFSKGGCRWIEQDGDAGHARGNLLEQFYPLARHRALDHGEPGGVAAGTRKAPHESTSHGVGNLRENEWNGACPFQQSRRVGSAVRNEEIWLQGHQFARVSITRLPIAGAYPANLDLDVVSPPELGEFLAERVHARRPFRVSLGIRHQHADASHPLRLLRAGRERPCGSSAAEQRDELAALHSITSSAVASSLSGTVRPSIRALS